MHWTLSRFKKTETKACTCQTKSQHPHPLMIVLLLLPLVRNHQPEKCECSPLWHCKTAVKWDMSNKVHKTILEIYEPHSLSSLPICRPFTLLYSHISLNTHMTLIKVCEGSGLWGDTESVSWSFYGVSGEALNSIPYCAESRLGFTGTFQSNRSGISVINYTHALPAMTSPKCLLWQKHRNVIIIT